MEGRTSTALALAAAGALASAALARRRRRSMADEPLGSESGETVLPLELVLPDPRPPRALEPGAAA